MPARLDAVLTVIYLIFDSPAEQCDKSPVTIASLSDHLAHVGRRREPLERVANDRVKTVDTGKPGNKK